MEDQTAILTGSLQADPFETQMRGYNRRQVEDYITRTKEQIGGLEARLSAALDAAERARLEAAAIREQLQQQHVTNRPAHEEVSERLSQILRLAAEEAEQERTNAESEISLVREQAEAEVQQLLEQTRTEADAVLATARQQAEDELTQARGEAERLLASSQEEADHTLTEARTHADRLRAQAERRAAAINGVLDERLAVLTEAHGAVVRQLAEIRDTVGGVLASDAGAGSLVVDLTPVEQSELDAAAGAFEIPAEDRAAAHAVDGGTGEPVMASAEAYPDAGEPGSGDEPGPDNGYGPDSRYGLDVDPLGVDLRTATEGSPAATEADLSVASERADRESRF